MDGKIVLELNRGEFDDNFSEKELWQTQAAKKLTEVLTQTAKQARAYKCKRQEYHKGHKLQTIHDAIFVSGSRGAGKTVFLRNAQSIWESDYDKRTSQNDKYKLHFCNEIDPTLLVNHDNFANVIIAHLYNAIEERLSYISSRDDIADKSSKFYISLKNLASALGNAEHNDSQLMGIDRIIGYRSGIQLERYFHEFAEQCVNILNVDAIVIPIDDVDMALDRAFEVLDVVRRLLGCPFIIPIVSGDELLFRPILNDHFSKLGKDGRAAILDDEQSAQLTQAYLTKVFQSQLRVVLQPIERLLKQLVIVEDENEFTFGQYRELINENFYFLTNGEEKSQHWPEPTNAREVSLLVRTIQPSLLQKKQSPWDSFKTWAYTKQHGVAYTNAIAVEQFKEIEDEGRQFSLNTLLPFNPLLQADDYDTHWKEKDFRSEQEACLHDLRQVNDSGKGSEEYIHLLDVFNDRKVLRSMPPVEYYLARLSIANIKEKPNADGLEGTEHNRALLLASFYTHKDYYGKSQALRSQVFFSRAFDFLCSSLILCKKRESDESIKFWKEFIENLQAAPPFYTASAITPTKSISIDLANEDSPKEEIKREALSAKVTTNPDEEGTLPAETGDETSSKEETTNIDVEIKVDFSAFTILMSKWEMQNAEWLNNLGQESLLPLIHSVFNKVFTQLHLMRADSKAIFIADYLSDVAKRFEYIVLNAFASFLKPQNIIKTNIARTNNVSTIRNESKLISSDNAYSGNVVNYLKNIDSSQVTNQQKLLEAIKKHPLFTLVKSGDTPVFSLLYTNAAGTIPIERKSPGYSLEAFKDIKKLNKENFLLKLGENKVQKAKEYLDLALAETQSKDKKIEDCTSVDKKLTKWLENIRDGKA